MTKLLRDAISQVEKLPDGEQDAAAAAASATAPIRAASWSRMMNSMSVHAALLVRNV